MHVAAEREAATLRTARDRPPGEGARHFDHILLRIAAVHAQRMQLHQFPRVVLVEATSPRHRLLRRLWQRGILRHALLHRRRASRRLPRIHRPLRRPQRGPSAVGYALPVVEVVEHCGALGHGTEQLAEVAQRMGADRLAVVLGEEIARTILPGEYVEMIFPEIDHHFVELTLADDRARHPTRGEFPHKRVRLSPLLTQGGGIGGTHGAAAAL